MTAQQANNSPNYYRLMAVDIDIKETWLNKKYKTAFKALLIDHTTHENIYWATDSYEELGDGYRFFDPITVESVTDDEKTGRKNGNVIRPRSVKSKEEQTKRVKDKAEVFTPSWVCNAQNNLVDEAWFGRPNVFNEEYIDENGVHRWKPTEGKIEDFPEGKSWKDYVNEMRLEITCGEAPYLVSRYDTTTGDAISIVEADGSPDRRMVFNRIGLLDRKLRLICENVDKPSSWLYYAELAFQSTYGFEWQGDNLLLARENLLLTLKDYYEAMFPNEQIKANTMKSFAYIISWNLWQMDGITFGLPGREVKEQLPKEESENERPQPATLTLQFEDDEPAEVPEVHIEPYERYCRIKNWKYKTYITKNKKKKPELAEAEKNEDFKQIFALIANKK